ncbi:MAG TPA: TIGR02757 family protein [Deltaproteobacteria bacterium]|nr:MAG: TIGR02757 family protein [Deltaproteobacteria bacterium GWD2_42_10]OGQ24003.1 MAG: TIGR02757 family protein [Deltaproteobacteria bacterium RIFCSPHIGHO2_02_FULL_42_44]OGQ37168.1 MAG: TIGR02757 family protein [Deltaproteobacteria bacterium RIFCSPLOWO2_02_FULL_42_39]OGQ65816.1 MAG: TIGR02757 family protein [Deltaproteobacteria bacterium RIFCSPLOWO2_12_FULL_42_16]OGQ74893.1 MAG: TIGR02757 family protein [Deltaproteobacteria bacterium RIFOXYA2_FULL_42_10]HCY19124.1 TIGR02757 family protein 
MKNLKPCLDKLYRTFDLKFLSPDPLEFIHKFKTSEDKEIVGLIASSLAYGQVERIRSSIKTVLERMDNKPYRFTVRFNPVKDKGLFDGFVHRFNTGRDIACLIYFAKQMIEESGSVGGFFLKGYSTKDANIKNSLISFSERVLSLDVSALYGTKSLPTDAGVRFFFPSPKNGSPCKRLNLYLRWMVRKGDRLDFGLWKDISASKLIIPLDTHIARISQNIGLTKRKSPDWNMAEEITENLKKLDPQDPVKYDFALCRLGILEHCPKKKDFKKCEKCLIKKVCVL